MNSISLSY